MKVEEINWVSLEDVKRQETLEAAIELAGKATPKQFLANLKRLVPKEILEK